MNKMVHVYPYHHKSEAVEILDRYLAQQFHRLQPRATCIQTDAGTEFLSKEWGGRCRKAGLSPRHAPPSCQAMNGQVEKDQGTLAETTRTMLKGRGVPMKYWPLALQTAAFLKNRTPHEALGGESPVKVGTGETPELRRLHTFGCAAYVQIDKGLREGKGGDVRWKGVFVGYSPESPAWLVLDPRSGRIREAYHVKFVDSEPGMCRGQGGAAYQNKRLNSAQFGPQATEETQHRECTVSEVDNTEAGLEEEGNPGQDADAENESVHDGQQSEGACQEGTQGLRRSARAGTPRDLWDPSVPTTDGLEKLRRERELYPDQALLAVATTTRCHVKEPRNWREAACSGEWLASMKRERDTLRNMSAYTLVPRETSMRVESGIWRFRAKRDQDGNVVKLKSRYVLDGSRQWSPFGREDTYSPVAELSSIRSLLACAAEKEWKVIQADFSTAYQNAKLDEPVYMQQPPGLEEGERQMVWKLSRAIYGMKQSGKLWYDELRGTLRNLRYQPTCVDPCVFQRGSGDARDIIAVYVDDLLITGTSDRGKLDSLVSELGGVYSVTNLGTANHLLGINICCTEEGIRLDQAAYLRSTLEEAGAALTPRSTPWDSRASEDDPGEALDTKGAQRYRRLLGKVM
ncbi:MAG: hypothetical protein GY753_08035, partial [Gammaproteobacteria bacterium]|nr:hypothetical protein [Gammaproteobacteria bacterium]